MREKTLILISLILGSVGHLATDIYLPSMPIMAEYFNASPALLQMTLTVYMLSFCITPLIIGPLSDSIGRKKPILLGLYLSMISTVLCIFANHVYLLILGRLLQGIGLGTVVSVSRAILPDHFQGKQLARYFSYLTILMPIILAIGPPLGGFIQDQSAWQYVFGFILFYLVLIRFLIRYFFLDKDPATQSNLNLHKAEAKIKLYFHSYKSLVVNRQYLKYTFCTSLLFLGVIAYLTMSPFYFQEVSGLTPSQYGYISLGLCATTCCSGFINSRLIHTFNPRSLLFFANGMMFCSGLILMLLHYLGMSEIYFVIPSLCVFFFAVPISFANTGALALANVQGNFGAATALLFALQYCGGSLGSFIISFTDRGSLFPLGLTFSVVALLYCLALLMPETKAPNLQPQINL